MAAPGTDEDVDQGDAVWHLHPLYSGVASSLPRAQGTSDRVDGWAPFALERDMGSPASLVDTHLARSQPLRYIGKEGLVTG